MERLNEGGGYQYQVPQRRHKKALRESRRFPEGSLFDRFLVSLGFIVPPCRPKRLCVGWTRTLLQKCR